MLQLESLDLGGTFECMQRNRVQSRIPRKLPELMAVCCKADNKLGTAGMRCLATGLGQLSNLRSLNLERRCRAVLQWREGAQCSPLVRPTRTDPAVALPLCDNFQATNSE